MCTAISYLQYFGRNLDLDRHYGEQVTIVPENFPLAGMATHSAIIGMATVLEGYPLFFEGTNEAGLSVAALNFPGNAVYHKAQSGKENIPSYDLIAYVLTRCKTCRDARQLLGNSVITDAQFGNYPATPLHWMIADREESLVVESTAEGLQLYDNPVGVMTNSPPFTAQLENLRNHQALHGAFDSTARFIRAAFIRNHTKDCDVSHFFRMLDAVSVPEGCIKTEIGYQRTLYSCCCDSERGIYYYTTEHNRQITAVDMHNADLEGDSIAQYPLVDKEQIHFLLPQA
ncbi:MAG: linear amide C-N hydrolase [Ruminococcaceae bacterium]|nr:linear amide C-N hydrolase [Oscillospiraceae bacterium]